MAKVRKAPRDASNLGAVIQAYMCAHGLSTHGEMAAVLGVDRTFVTKYVSGARRCHDVTQLRRFAEVMDLPAETFGLLPDPQDASSVDGPPSDEASEWCLVRRTLNPEPQRTDRGRQPLLGPRADRGHGLHHPAGLDSGCAS